MDRYQEETKWTNKERLLRYIVSSMDQQIESGTVKVTV